jgi:hypothetical protein
LEKILAYDFCLTGQSLILSSKTGQCLLPGWPGFEAMLDNLYLESGKKREVSY